MKFWSIELARVAGKTESVLVAVSDDGTLIEVDATGATTTKSYGSRAGAGLQALRIIGAKQSAGYAQARSVAVLELVRTDAESLRTAYVGASDPVSAEAPTDATRVFKSALADLTEATRSTSTAGRRLGPTITAGPVDLAHGGAMSYRRPNGEEYFPRTIGSLEDVAVLRTARDAGHGALFFGAPGCGKTALVEAAFPDAVTLVGSRGTEYADFVGRYLPHPERPGAYSWFDGPLVLAALQGIPFFADEIALIDPQEMSVMYPLQDGRGYIDVPERPDSVGGPRVVAQPGFAIFGAYNPYAPGARISEALWSRFFLKVEYTTDYALATQMKVPAMAVNAAIELDKMLRDESNELMWAPQMRELLRFRDVAAMFGIEFAASALCAEAPLDSRAIVESVVSSHFKGVGVSSLTTARAVTR